MDVYPSSLDPKVPGGLSPVTRGRNLLDRALWIPTPLLFHFCFSLVVFFCGHLSNKCPHPRVCFWRKQLRQPGRISKMFMHAQLPRSCLTLCDPIDCNLPASLSMEFSRQEYWSGLPFPSPRGSSRPRDQTHLSCVFCISRWILYPLSHLMDGGD